MGEVIEFDADGQVAAMNRLAREEAGSGVDGGMPPDGGDGGGVEEEDLALPYIELPRVGRRLADFAREAGAICRDHGVYRRDTTVVLVNRETGVIEVLEDDTFRTFIEDLAVTYKQQLVGKGDKEKTVRLPTTMTTECARGTLSSRQFLYKLKSLEKVNQVQQPVVRGDGRIELLSQGYDDESGIFTMPSQVEIKDDMTLDMAHHLLLDLHREFDFADWNKERTVSRDLAAHIGAMVAFYGAGLLPPLAQRLGALYNANSHRSGKTLLFKLVVTPVIGRCRVRSKPKNDEEFRKMLDAASLAASPYIIMDDVAGNLRSNELNAFMTSPYWTGRVMGGQKEFDVINRAMVFVTGHGLTIESDLAGRFLQCKLHLDEADVQDRAIRRVIDDEFLANESVRSDVLTALWTLIREWDKAGRAKGSTMMGGFQKWCEIFGGIVEAAGFGDPCVRPPDDESADSEFEDMMALVTDLADKVNTAEGNRTQEFTFPEVLDVAVEQDCFPWLIEGRWKKVEEGMARHYEATPKTKAAMGKIFSMKYGGRLFKLKDGRCVRFGNRGKNRQRRYLVTLEG
ncbi:MAG: hypothetical protein QM496_02020 [Verrucomicrobiota bacterium]